MKTRKIEFENRNGQKLAARLDIPLGQRPEAIALFAHCFTCSKSMLEKARDLADKMNSLLHIHVSEDTYHVKRSLKDYGKRPVEFLDEIGFLSSNVLASQCVHLSKKEIGIMSSVIM